MCYYYNGISTIWCVFIVSDVESRSWVDWAPLRKRTGPERAVNSEEADQWAGDEDQRAEPTFRFWETRVCVKMEKIEKRCKNYVKKDV